MHANKCIQNHSAVLSPHINVLEQLILKLFEQSCTTVMAVMINIELSYRIYMKEIELKYNKLSSYNRIQQILFANVYETHISLG